MLKARDMLATLVVILLDASLFIKLASGGELLLCIYPAPQVQGISCSKDGSSLISIDKVQATRLGKDTTACAQEKSRNASVMSQCTYDLDNRDFYYQFQHPRCNLQRSCLVHDDFPSAIVILGSDNCTADSTGHERNAVIIKWSCFTSALWSPLNGSDASTTSEPLAATLTTTLTTTLTIASPAGSNDISGISLAAFGTIVGSAVFITFVIVTFACLLILARQRKLLSWLTILEKLQDSFPGSSGRAGDIKTEGI